MRKRKGSFLVFSLLIFMVLILFVTVILHLLNTNNYQIRLQEQTMEAYYLAYSGTVLAKESLFMDNNDLFKKLKGNNTIVYTQKLTLDNGIINITAKQSNNENYEGWIEINSIATLDDAEMTFTRVLYINPEDPGENVWVNK
ncbi:hypothetical protein E8P77_01875 [Soehngenia saccharolytica]|nr:hypothetical protein E8P77_01875 [Soehngenia saccharolytica]